MAIEAVRRIDELFAIEAEINGQSAAERLAVRQTRAKPLIENLETWLRDQRRKLSSKSPVAKAIDYSLKRWPAFTRFLDDGRICLSNNAAERSVRGIAMGRKAWLFSDTPRGADASAKLYSLIETAKACGLEPITYLAHIFEKLPQATTLADLEALLPWAVKAAAIAAKPTRAARQSR